jgi:hypothetical protein
VRQAVIGGCNTLLNGEIINAAGQNYYRNSYDVDEKHNMPSRIEGMKEF